MKTKILFLILILFLIGCTSSEKKNTQPDDGAIVIDVNSALKGEARYIEDMVESVEVIPLETTEESIVGDVSNCLVTDNYIFINDLYEHRGGLAMFDRHGKFIKRFRCGNGPEEIISAFNIFYSNDAIYVGSVKMLYKISLDGKFLGSKENEFVPSITKIPDGFLMIQSETMNDDGQFKVIKTDTNLVKISEHCLDSNPFLSNTGIDCFDGVNSLIYRFADNNIYTFSDDGIKVKYRLSYPDFEYQIPYAEYENLPMEQRLTAASQLLKKIDEDKYIFIGELLDSDDYLTFYIVNEEDWLPVLFNKNTGKAFVQEHQHTEPFSPFTFMYRNKYAHITGQKNTFSGILTSSIAADCCDNNPHNLFSDKDIEVLKNAKEDDNPIVVIYKLKDNL
ncbi:MAG: 6-bladed beta-propeller [Bacteroidales bacterium]|nr:6-bladed beta-propeller [Bacteroidales bacterium]